MGRSYQFMIYQENASCVYKIFQMSSSLQLLIFPHPTCLNMLRRCLHMKNRVVMRGGSVIFKCFRFVHIRIYFTDHTAWNKYISACIRAWNCAQYRRQCDYRNFFTLATKSWKLVAKLATWMFHHNLTKRYSELKRFAKINPSQTSSLSLFPKRNRCISIDN